VRTLCPDCKTGYQPEAAELEELALEYSPADSAKLLKEWRKPGFAALQRAKGCEKCDQTGYKGRMALFELLVADAAMKRLVQTRAPVTEIAAAAARNGMRTLKQDGITKVLQGLTDIIQVRMVSS
jgi:type II secretory ATPase GspE/PulE/Tfp pilus assembly ATPase PilB-like protein